MTRTSARKTAALLELGDLNALPGHLFRRLQQQAVALFMQETASVGATPVQFAVLHALAQTPGMDQRTLAQHVSFDTSTIAGVVDRLEARGWVTRSLSPHDRRVRLLNLTAEGEHHLALMYPMMLQAQQRMLAPLTPAQRKVFMSLLQTIVDHHSADQGDADAAP